MSSMRDAYLTSLQDLMFKDNMTILLSADFGSPVIDSIRENFPDRFINVGIAEQNLINVATGLALEGYKVFAYAIAPFITMRCLEQIRVNLGLLSTIRKLNINLIGVGAGYSYVVSGPTHQCYEDISLVRTIPNIEIYSPCDSITTSLFPEHAAKNTFPKYFRLDAQVLTPVYSNEKPNLLSGYNILVSGKDICLISTGYMTQTALSICDMLEKNNIHATIIDIHSLTTFNEANLKKIIEPFDVIATLEEGFIGVAGVDAIISNLMRNSSNKLLCFGVQRNYTFEIGSREHIHEKIGIGKSYIFSRIKSALIRNSK